MAYTVFVSYAEQDKKYRQELNKHLSTLKNGGLISDFHEGDIAPGTIWEEQMRARLQSAQIILLLISADFISSKFCYSVEMQTAIERHKRGEARVIPILLRPTDYEDTPFAGLAMLPAQNRPITSYKKDEAYVKITKGIRAAIQDLAKEKSQPVQTKPADTVNTKPLETQQQAKVFLVPFERNELFTGREEILARLHNNLSANRAGIPPRAQVISGLGGIGKTQTALEYAYLHKEEYAYVFWLRAETIELLNEDFSIIAEAVGLPTKHIQDQGLIVAAVKNWLRTHEGWLLILDNADDPEQIYTYIGRQLKGHLLLTSRAPTDAGGMNTLEMENMSLEVGSVFLLRRAHYLEPEQNLEEIDRELVKQAREIVQTVDGLPLALAQAGAYIAAMRCGLAGYLERYKSKGMLFLRDKRGLTEEHPEPVSLTWLLSFERVEHANRAAADLLRLCAFLHPDAIPDAMFRAGKKVLTTSLQEIADDFSRWDEALAELLKYSLIRRQEGEILTVHRLVQKVLREGLDEDGQKQWAEQAVRMLNEVFQDEGPFELWSKCKLYLQHVQICATWITELQIVSVEVLQLLTKAGRYLYKSGQYAESEPLLLQAQILAEQAWSGEAYEVAYVLNELAELRRLQGKFPQAFPIAQRAVQIYEQDEQHNQAAMATSLNTLGRIYHEQGNYPEAAELYERALEIRKQVLGEQHPDVAHSLNDLGALYNLQGKPTQAQLLHQQAREIRERVYGIEHPDTLSSLNNLASLYQDQSRFSLAEPLFLQVRDLSAHLLGPDHPNTLSSLNNLAILYQAQDRYTLAEPLFLQVRDLRTHLLGPDHPDTLISLNNLASLYHDQGRYIYAERDFKRVISISERVLGFKHPHTAMSKHNLAVLYAKTRNFTKAEPLFQQALKVYEETLGPEHPTTISLLGQYVSLLWITSKKRAEKMQKVLEERRKKVLEEQGIVGDEEHRGEE